MDFIQFRSRVIICISSFLFVAVTSLTTATHRWWCCDARHHLREVLRLRSSLSEQCLKFPYNFHDFGYLDLGVFIFLAIEQSQLTHYGNANNKFCESLLFVAGGWWSYGEAFGCVDVFSIILSLWLSKFCFFSRLEGCMRLLRKQLKEHTKQGVTEDQATFWRPNTKTCRFLIVKVARVAEKGHLLVWKHLFEELLSLGSVLSWFPSKLAARNHHQKPGFSCWSNTPISGVRKPIMLGIFMGRTAKMDRSWENDDNRLADEGLCTPLGLLLPTSSTRMLGKRSRWNLGDFLRTLASHFGHLVV